jgi:hypothetical protein
MSGGFQYIKAVACTRSFCILLGYFEFQLAQGQIAQAAPLSTDLSYKSSQTSYLRKPTPKPLRPSPN